MKYFFIQETEFDETKKHTAGSKAREDINEIAIDMGFEPIEVQYDLKLRENRGFVVALKKITSDWKRALRKIGKGDVVLIQFPLNHHPLGVARYLKKIQKRGGKIVFLIHDIDSLRMKRSSVIDKIKHAKVIMEDHTILKRSNALIAHNSIMKKKLSDMGIDARIVVSLEIFDYLIHCNLKRVIRKKDDPIVVAGTLRKGKAEYVYNLPIDSKFNLYGVGYENEKKENITYKGAFTPEELPNIIRGGFGLIWDGRVVETCEGITGQYLKINNPHKTSLYLLCGLPVAVWDEAAIANFVKKNKCGITISSIHDLKKTISNMTEAEYETMCNNAKSISDKLIRGEYSRKAIQKAIDILKSEK